MEHTYYKCTMRETGACKGCRYDGRDCKYESYAICMFCGGIEGSLLPSCPGRRLTNEEHDANYEHYCNGTGPFAKCCRYCSKETDGFDERGAICIDCATVLALKESK